MATLNSPDRDSLEQDVYAACAKSAEGADLLISAFIGALRSYRRGSVCAPFPGFLINNVSDKDFKSATELVAHFPPTQVVASSGYSGSEGTLNPVQNIPLRALMLLHWILRFRYHVHLVQDRDQISGLLLPDALGRSSKQDKNVIPSQVLEIQDMDEHSINAFQAAKAQHGSIMAFHGTTAESLHSILRSGLLNMSNSHLKQNGTLYGQGVYLSTDLEVASFFCKPGDTWEKSCFGPRVKYVLQCEVAKGEGVTCPDLQESQRTIFDRKAKRLVSKSAVEMHGTYVVVSNSSLIRIRFVFVYCDYPKDYFLSYREAEVTNSANRAFAWKNAIVKHVGTIDWFTFMVLLYVGLLLVVGFSKSGVSVNKSSVMVMKQLSWISDRMRVWIDSWTNTPNL